MKVRPLRDRLLVKRVEEEEKTKGGIIIPATAKEKPVQGTVVAAGPGVQLENGKLRPLDVHEKDQILFARYAGTDIVVDGEDHLVLREEDVLPVVRVGGTRATAAKEIRFHEEGPRQADARVSMRSPTRPA